ncbi:hypothetical protein D3C75_910200 [compost metagenome]
MVIAENFGVDLVPYKRRLQVFPNKSGLLFRQHKHSRIMRRFEQRLILRSDSINRKSVPGVRLNVPDKIIGIHSVIFRLQLACDHRPAGLHPARRAPGRSHQLNRRIQRHRLLQQRNDVDFIMGDREPVQFHIGFPFRQIIIAVHRSGVIRGAHRIAQDG